MSQHEQLEAICALAASGQMDEAERQELNRHLENCADCRERVADFAQISAQALPLHAESYQRSHSTRELTFRFVVRARAEGIPLREVKPSFARRGNWLRPVAWGTVFAAALGVLMVIAGGTAYLQLRPHLNPRASSQISRPQNANPSALPKAYTDANRSHESAGLAVARSPKRSVPVRQSRETRELSALLNFDNRTQANFFVGSRNEFTVISLGNGSPNRPAELYASNHVPDGLIVFTRISSANHIHGFHVGAGTFGGPVASTWSGTNVFAGPLRHSGQYFSKNDTFLYVTHGNAFRSSILNVLPDHSFSYSFRAFFEDGQALAEKVDVPAIFRRQRATVEIDWHDRWLKRLEQIFPTPNRSSLNASDLASSFNVWAGIDQEKLTAQIDWHQRWASTSSERLLALRNSSQCASDPALRLNAWAGIPKPNPNLEIDWHQRWLNRDSEKPLSAGNPAECPLAERTLQSKVKQ